MVPGREGLSQGCSLETSYWLPWEELEETGVHGRGPLRGWDCECPQEQGWSLGWELGPRGLMGRG